MQCVEAYNFLRYYACIFYQPIIKKYICYCYQGHSRCPAFKKKKKTRGPKNEDVSLPMLDVRAHPLLFPDYFRKRILTIAKLSAFSLKVARYYLFTRRLLI